MKLRAIICWPSVVGALAEAGRNLDFLDLKIRSMKELEENEEECLADLADADVIFLNPNNNEVWERAEPAVRRICGNIPTVFAPMDLSLTSLSNVDGEVAATCMRYFVNAGPDNFRNLLLYIGKEIMKLDVEAEPPKEIPWEGIYHPESEECFSGIDDYLKWYKPDYDRLAGILFYRSYWVNNNFEIEKALIREFERQGVGVIPVFTESVGRTDCGSRPSSEVLSEFFIDENGNSRIEALINLQFAVLSGARNDESLSVDAGVELLKKLNIPVFHPIISYSKTEEEWRNEFSAIGSGSIGWSVAMPEFEGVIEPLISGAVSRETDESSGTVMDKYRPIGERIEKIVARVKAWIDLRTKAVDERKVAFILHNNPCASVEASVGGGAHLDTLESVARIIKRMEEHGYEIGDSPGDGKELIDTIMDRKVPRMVRWFHGQG